MINVTKTFLPPIDDYIQYLQKIWENGWITNHGPFVNKLELKLKEYFGIKHAFLITNGTLALQICAKALKIKRRIITTPFSYIATASSFAWEGIQIDFVDIDENSLNIDPKKIEEKITKETEAIVATHVYGNPCAVEELTKIASKYDLKLIFDAAHAFGVTYKNRHLVSYGDISVISFHATKLFHTVEGGLITTNDDNVAERVFYQRNFGHKGQEEFWGLGINGKMSEMHAAMGLCNLKYVEEIVRARKERSYLYDKNLNFKTLKKPSFNEKSTNNYSYYPVIFNSETQLKSIVSILSSYGIYPRRYFYPSLNSLNFFTNKTGNPISERVSKRVLCLPLFHDLEDSQIITICNLINNSI